MPLEVVVEYSDKEKSLTVADTGIGMSCDDMHAFLGSIGKSGTAEFLDKLEKNKDALIGNFGVGFFSVSAFQPYLRPCGTFHPFLRPCGTSDCLRRAFWWQRR